MELRLLRYFVAVAEERHIGRAARRLQMTQPPVSRAVQQLERELGVTLLLRRPTGVELTLAGSTLYREARTMLDQADRLAARIGAAGGTPTITVGTCADTVDQLGSRLVTAFRRRHPDVGLTLWETDLTDPSAGLRTDVVDVAQDVGGDRGVVERFAGERDARAEGEPRGTGGRADDPGESAVGAVEQRDHVRTAGPAVAGPPGERAGARQGAQPPGRRVPADGAQPVDPLLRRDRRGGRPHPGNSDLDAAAVWRYRAGVGRSFPSPGTVVDGDPAR